MRQVCPREPRAWRAVALWLLPSLAACFAAGRAERGPPGEPLRVLVYNIHAGKDAAGVDNLARVARLIDSTGADVVLLQEVDRHTERSGSADQLAELARRSGLRGAFGKTLDFQGGEYGIAVLSRWPIVDDSLVRLPVSPPQERAGGSYEPRGVLHVTIAAPGGPLHVLNTHLDPSRDDHYRRQEAAHLVALADRLRAAGAPALVGGDLNATPESAVIGMLRAAGLRDAWAECGRGEGGSYPAATPVKRIDYLFLPASRTCSAAQVIAADASDHRPLFVTVTVRRG